MSEQIRGVREITEIGQPADIGQVRFGSKWVIVGRNKHREAGVPQPKTEPTRAGEEIDSSRASLLADPSPNCSEVGRVRRRAKRLQSEAVSPLEGNLQLAPWALGGYGSAELANAGPLSSLERLFAHCQSHSTARVALIALLSEAAARLRARPDYGRTRQFDE
jgi:hypothetical protein